MHTSLRLAPLNMASVQLLSRSKLQVRPLICHCPSLKNKTLSLPHPYVVYLYRQAGQKRIVKGEQNRGEEFFFLSFFLVSGRGGRGGGFP